MKQETKYKALIFAVIVLALLNITTIATIVIGNRNIQRDDSIVIDPQSSPISGRYLRQELSLSSDQMDIIREESRKFRHNANEILDKMNFYKSELYNQIHSDTPDSSRIKAYSDSIGFKHARLKELTAGFYLNIRNRCNPEQREKLTAIFEPLFRDYQQMRGPGGGRGHEGAAEVHGVTNETDGRTQGYEGRGAGGRRPGGRGPGN